MVWRLTDLIHLHVTDVRQSELKDSKTPLSLCDKLLNTNERELLFTFEPQKQEVFDAFNEIVRSESSYITTLGQVMDFVKFCTADPSKYSFPVLAGVLLTDLPNLKLPKDLLVVIEFED
jgi:hypothetical protein